MSLKQLAELESKEVLKNKQNPLIDNRVSEGHRCQPKELPGPKLEQLESPNTVVLGCDLKGKRASHQSTLT